MVPFVVFGFMNHIQTLQNSIYAYDKKKKLILTKRVKQAIVVLASQIKTPTLVDVVTKLQCDNAKAELILKSVKAKRKQLSEVTGTFLPGMQRTGKEGFIYLVKNPAYPGWIKCGMATDCGSRLKSYNGYDPIGGFSFIATQQVVDRRKAERQLLHDVSMKACLQNGEWFKIDESICIEIFNEIC
jgi:hypothetical protein